MEAASSLVTNRAGTTTDKDGNSLGVFTFLNQNYSLVRGTEGNLLDKASLTELLGGDLLEAGNNAAISGNGEQFNFNTTNPSNGGQLILHEQMVGLIVEAPLAEDDVSAGVLDLLDHVVEVVLFHLLELLVVFNGLDLDTVLGLGLWGLEGAGQNANLCVFDLLSHGGVGEVLVNNDTFNKLGVLDSTTRLGDNLNEVEVDILTVKVSDVEN